MHRYATMQCFMEFMGAITPLYQDNSQTSLKAEHGPRTNTKQYEANATHTLRHLNATR
jgi:hypothetical protein